MRGFRFALLFLVVAGAHAAGAYTRQDTLRGSNGSGRSWWDVQRYDLRISFDTAKKSISGSNRISFIVTQPTQDSMQIDLQDGMFLDNVYWGGKKLDFVKEGNVFWVKLHFKKWTVNSRHTVELMYHGRPREAKSPPWDGGFIWSTDTTGKPWIAVACQGLGASSWWPCKDYQGDEPDSGMNLSIDGIKGLPAISNGRAHPDTILMENPVTLEKTLKINQSWFVRNPINTYDVTFYIGDYIHWSDTLMGEKGRLDLDFYALRPNEAKARSQFAVVKKMLHCFEDWMVPYPFYEDGYKLVEAPFLGMEHQSAVAYGNKYQMGYKGSDRSHTGVGMNFDFIIIHESGHEWFGNSITAKDIADNWLHEGLTTYTEALFTECLMGRDSAFAYTRGQWKNIKNEKPVIGEYGVNKDGSSDRYDKGSAVIHMIRMMLDDDGKFRELLRGLNQEFYHRIVTTAEVEDYISRFTGKDLKPFFDQYLRTVRIPKLEWYQRGKTIHYRFSNGVDRFTLPITITCRNKTFSISPNLSWQETRVGKGAIIFPEDFLVSIVEAAP